MSQDTSILVGLDVHKDAISVVDAAGGGNAPPHFVAQIGTGQCVSTNVEKWSRVNAEKLTTLSAGGA